MITRLRLENFKSFKSADIAFGPLTVLVGANATGKSNIREAFRVLKGLASGYSVAEVLQGKILGDRDYMLKPVRGGSREAAYRGEPHFKIATEHELDFDGELVVARHGIRVALQVDRDNPLIDEETVAERLSNGTWNTLFDPTMRPGGVSFPTKYAFVRRVETGTIPDRTHRLVQAIEDELRFALFFDLDPDTMRRLSPAGATALGDRGENLQSVLASICRDKVDKRTLLSWIKGLVPSDVSNLRFDPIPNGDVLMSLTQDKEFKYTTASASDGTLRFLGMLAALFQRLAPHYAFYFDEVDTGLHPTRLHLLANLLEMQSSDGVKQIVASTHSPGFLQSLQQVTLQHAQLTYRLEGQPDTKVIRLLDVPNVTQILQSQDLMRLFESGWFEDTLYFGSEDAESAA